MNPQDHQEFLLDINLAHIDIIKIVDIFNMNFHNEYV